MMQVRDLKDRLENANPDWEVVIVSPEGTFDVAYLENSGSERRAMLVPQARTKCVDPAKYVADDPSDRFRVANHQSWTL